MNAIQISNLTKCYGKSRGIIDLSLTVQEGEFFGYIGPNGAGKSTTIRTLLGLISPDSGSAQIFGMDIRNDRKAVLSKVGYLPSEAIFYSGAKVKDILKLSADLRKRDCSREAAVLCDRLQLNLSRRVSELSFGNRKKVAIVCALQHTPDLLILDEPTSGLDPVSRDELLHILSEYIEDGEHSVLFSTHITGDLERTADYITYISYGELFFSGGKDEFVDSFRIVKGGREELSDDLGKKAFGIREFTTGFEALIKTEDLRQFAYLNVEPATIDDIVVFTSKRGEQYE